MRVKGCWSRGLTRGAVFNKNNKQNPVINYKLPFFSSDLKKELTSNQKNLLHFFENYSYVKKIESFKYNKNTPYAIVNLKNSDFKNGTLRITTPGIYRLTENIVFNPNEFNDFSPTSQQITSGLYPENMHGPYHLGFFAAVTIETNDVIFDLNNYNIKQSDKHNFQQRFFSLFELASSPFFEKQGPAQFNTGTTYKVANRLLLMNGHLKLSSHHAIHGNAMKNLVFSNLNISDFEVASIHLNGSENVVINNVKIENNKNNILVNSAYSQARFIRKFLNLAVQNKPSLKIGTKSISDIKKNLNDDLNNTYSQFVNSGSVPDNFFKNNCPSKPCEYDGNVYGMVLNVVGVAVNDFLSERPSEDKNPGNKDIYLGNITINNISSTPVEVIALNAAPQTNDSAYGGRVQVGPVGDVLNIELIQDQDGNYTGNSLSDAQIILADKSYTGPKGTNNIVEKVVNWANGASKISDFVKEGSGNFYYVGGGDSMNHVMKGNIGMFISGGLNIKMNKITINNILSNGNKVGISTLKPIVPDPLTKKGLAAYSLLLTGGSNVTLKNSHIMDAHSENGENKATKLIGNNNSLNIL